MGCGSSKREVDVVKTSGAPTVTGTTAGTAVTPTKDIVDTAASPAPVTTPTTPNPIATSDTVSLRPPYHTDEHGNLVDDATGGRVWSEAWYVARKEADEHAKLRGECFDKSKAAFEKGEKGEAKTLSEEGKRHGQLMEDANKRAVAEIMGYQNLEEDKLDLHGLLVKEAVDCTKTFVAKHHALSKFRQLTIIPGAGHHSDAKGAKTKPAIVELAKEEKWNLNADEGNEGSFTLSF